MASATLLANVENQVAADDAATPIWWQQRHTYALAAMVVAHFGSLATVVQWALDASSDTANEAVQGALLGQCLLLGLWAALGGLRAIPRWLTVLAVYLAGVVTFQGARGAWQRADSWEEVLGIGLMGWLIVSASAIVLVPLRGLLGWRVDFDPAYYRHIQTRRGQVSFMQMAAYSCCVAGPLAVFRVIATLDESLNEAFLGFVVFVATMGGVGWTVALLGLSMRAWLAVPAAALWTLAMIGLHWGLGLVFDDLDWPLETYLRVDGGIALAVLLTILPLRWFGLKLLVVGRTQRN